MNEIKGRVPFNRVTSKWLFHTNTLHLWQRHHLHFTNITMLLRIVSHALRQDWGITKQNVHYLSFHLSHIIFKALENYVFLN